MTKTWRDFTDFCYDHDLNPRGRNVRWIKDPDGLRGLRDDWLLILDGGLDPAYVQHLVDIYGFILVPEPERPAPRPYFPEIKAIRGGIRFPTPEKRELEGTFL